MLQPLILKHSRILLLMYSSVPCCFTVLIPVQLLNLKYLATLEKSISKFNSLNWSRIEWDYEKCWISIRKAPEGNRRLIAVVNNYYHKVASGSNTPSLAPRTVYGVIFTLVYFHEFFKIECPHLNFHKLMRFYQYNYQYISIITFLQHFTNLISRIQNNSWKFSGVKKPSIRYYRGISLFQSMLNKKKKRKDSYI